MSRVAVIPAVFLPFAFSCGAVSGDVSSFGGPTSVEQQVDADSRKPQRDYFYSGFSESMESYYAFKEGLRNDKGFSFGADYNSMLQLSDSDRESNNAAGGVARVFGSWDILGSGDDKGSLIFKIENRHNYGSHISPQQLGPELGYAGLTSIVYSDAGNLLTNLYWQQSFTQGRYSFIAGIVDTTDYVDVYSLGNPWAEFSNLSFSTNPTIPAPSQGFGAAFKANIADNYYLIAGFADSNADPSNTADSFNTFVDDREYFKHFEFGWFESNATRFTDNIHLTLWQSDERKDAGVDAGQGAAFSYSNLIGDSWQWFARAGYSDGGGGSFLERTLAAGLGFHSSRKRDFLGVGVAWGKPASTIYGENLDDQYTLEIYYRMKLFPHVTLTPDLQFLKNPAANPDESGIWVAGLRLRLDF